MKVLTRYFLKELLWAFLLVLVAFIALFAFFDFLNELNDMGTGTYTLNLAILYVLLRLPGRIYELMPIAVLIGALYALTNLARHSEITVMRASGLTVAHLLSKLVMIGSLFVVATFLLGEYLSPPFENMAKQLKFKATGSSSIPFELSSGLWVKDKNRFINVDKMKADATMSKIRMYEFDEHKKLLSIIDAQQGIFDQEQHLWKLSPVTKIDFTENDIKESHLPEVDWHSDLSPDVLNAAQVKPELMHVGTLYMYLRHLNKNNQASNMFEIALWKKLTYPFAAIVMLVLAMPFSFLQSRMGGGSTKVFLGVMLGVGFYFLNGLSANLGIIFSFPPFLAAIAPSLVFLCAAAIMIRQVDRR